MRAHLSSLGLVAVIAMVFMPTSQAQVLARHDTFTVRVSGYLSEFDTSVKVDGDTQAGTPVNLKHDLGLDDNNVVANIGLTWRPLDRHEFGLNYYTKDADKTRTIPAAFDFNGNHYETHSTVHAAVDVESYEAYYTWWAASHDSWELGPRIGLVWYSIDLALAAQLDSNGAPLIGARDSVSADLPTLTIGGNWRWEFAEDWRLSADAGYFTSNIDNVDGDVYFGRVGVEWFPWEHSGFLLDYTTNRIKVDVDKSRFRGNVDFNDTGVRLGYVYRF